MLYYQLIFVVYFVFKYGTSFQQTRKFHINFYILLFSYLSPNPYHNQYCSCKPINRYIRRRCSCNLKNSFQHTSHRPCKYSQVISIHCFPHFSPLFNQKKIYPIRDNSKNERYKKHSIHIERYDSMPESIINCRKKYTEQRSN